MAPSDYSNLTNQEEELDSEISSIRREIRHLQRRRRFLSSSLLSSDKFHKCLRKYQPAPGPALASSLNEDVSPLIQAAGKHTESNHHRVAFSTTTFPFKDPSPNSDNPNLLGVRIDICARNGRFTKPYYVLLKRVQGSEEKKLLRVHRHTIPAFISIEKLEKLYLPFPSSSEGAGDEGEVLKPWKKRTRKQDLRGLVRELRRQLVAWHLRVDAIDILRGELGIVRDANDALDHTLDEHQSPENDLGIVSLSPTALEATYVRMEWSDGRVGRFKVSNTGAVERAVVIGDHGRDKSLEAVMTGGDGRVETVLDRLTRHIAFQI